MLRGVSEERSQAGQPANSAAPSPSSAASSTATSSELLSAVRPQGGGGPGQGDREEQGQSQEAGEGVRDVRQENSKEAGRFVLRPLFVYIENYEFVVFVFSV